MKCYLNVLNKLEDAKLDTSDYNAINVLTVAQHSILRLILGLPADNYDHVFQMTDGEKAIALRPDRKIEAIKAVRQRTGLGLKESKDIVDKFRYENGLT